VLIVGCVVGALLISVLALTVFVEWMEVTERRFETYEEAAKSGLVGEGRTEGWVPRSASYIHVRRDIDSNELWLAFSAPHDVIATRMSHCTPLSPSEVRYPRYWPRGWWPESLGHSTRSHSAAYKYYRCQPESVTAVDERGTRVFEWFFSS
jgi:hypothetical protein